MDRGTQVRKNCRFCILSKSTHVRQATAQRKLTYGIVLRFARCWVWFLELSVMELTFCWPIVFDFCGLEGRQKWAEWSSLWQK